MFTGNILKNEDTIFSFSNLSSKLKWYENILLKKLVKQVKKKMRKINLENTQNKLKAEINMEWKEVARRLDQFFLVISLITIIIVPAYLFGEYAFRDFFEKIESQKAKCGCEK